jgi:hypothetical protein
MFSTGPGKEIGINMAGACCGAEEREVGGIEQTMKISASFLNGASMSQHDSLPPPHFHFHWSTLPLLLTHFHFHLLTSTSTTSVYTRDNCVAKVSIKTTWFGGRQISEQELLEAGWEPPFKTMDEAGGYNIFCPFGKHEMVLLGRRHDEERTRMTMTVTFRVHLQLQLRNPSAYGGQNVHLIGRKIYSRFRTYRNIGDLMLVYAECTGYTQCNANFAKPLHWG